MKKIKKSDLTLNKDIISFISRTELYNTRGEGVTNNTLCLTCDRATFATVCLCDEQPTINSDIKTGGQKCCNTPIDPTTIKPATIDSCGFPPTYLCETTKYNCDISV